MIADEKWYAGWLYCDRDEIEHLKKMGVQGPMIWRRFDFESMSQRQSAFLRSFDKAGAISYCLCDKKTLERLANKYREWWETNYLHYDENDQDYPLNHFSPCSLGEAYKEWNWRPENG